MSENKFKIGDRIRVVSDHETWLARGQAYDSIFTAVSDCGRDDDVFCEHTWQVDLETLNDWPNDFELVERPVLSLPEQELTHVALPLPAADPKEVIIPMTRDKSEDVGVYRPDVDKRKADKVRIELFDDGFPNAILEIAKVLTWAQKVKGYKDHDWLNLPDPENTLKGAASRHRTKANIQKMSGVPAKERVDEESGMLHLCHQAFNILAEIEMILTGRIK